MIGHQVLKMALGWKIGNGKNVKIWQDTWLSTSPSEKFMAPPHQNHQNLSVADLIDRDSKTWNWQHIIEIIPIIGLLAPLFFPVNRITLWFY